MAPKGLVCPQGCPWSLLGSEDADQLGCQVFPSRTTDLYSVLHLEEIGKMPLYWLSLVLLTWHFTGQVHALCGVTASPTLVSSFL